MVAEAWRELRRQEVLWKVNSQFTVFLLHLDTYSSIYTVPQPAIDNHNREIVEMVIEGGWTTQTCSIFCGSERERRLRIQPQQLTELLNVFW